MDWLGKKELPAFGTVRFRVREAVREGRGRVTKTYDDRKWIVLGPEVLLRGYYDGKFGLDERTVGRDKSVANK